MLRDVASPFSKILLITGATVPAEFVAERARARAVAAICEARPDVEVSTAVASQLVPGEFAGLTSPSLFSEATALVLTGLEDLSEQPAAELLDFAAAPHEDIAVVLLHGGGNKGRGLLDKLRKLPSVDEVKLEVPKYDRDIAGWIKNEARDHGRTIADDAATLLATAVGSDLRALAGAIDQLVFTLEPGHPIDAATVGQYFGGRAEVRGYEIADAAMDGRLAEALEKARWAEATKVPAVLVTAAVASSLRQIALMGSAPQGLRDGELAAHVGVPPFKIRALRQQVTAWSPAGIARAIEAVAAADLETKGAGANPHYSIERMLISVTAARGRH
jgi:DNA polymerase-3 subunit delta